MLHVDNTYVSMMSRMGKYSWKSIHFVLDFKIVLHKAIKAQIRAISSDVHHLQLYQTASFHTLHGDFLGVSKLIQVTF